MKYEDKKKMFSEKSDIINRILDDVSIDEKISILAGITLVELQKQSKSDISFLYEVVRYMKTFLGTAIESEEVRNIVFDIIMRG